MEKHHDDEVGGKNCKWHIRGNSFQKMPLIVQYNQRMLEPLITERLRIPDRLNTSGVTGEGAWDPEVPLICKQTLSRMKHRSCKVQYLKGMNRLWNALDGYCCGWKVQKYFTFHMKILAHKVSKVFIHLVQIRSNDDEGLSLWGSLRWCCWGTEQGSGY